MTCRDGHGLYVCTLPVGHAGPHAAEGLGGDVAATWEQPWEQSLRLLVENVQAQVALLTDQLAGDVRALRADIEAVLDGGEEF